jgi:hypothetical protein
MLGGLIKAAQAVSALLKGGKKIAVKAAQKAQKAFHNVSRKTVQSCKLFARNRKIRQAYNARKRVLEQEIKKMKAQGKSPQEIAKRSSEFRHNERMVARKQMKKNGDNHLVKKLEQRDIKKYDGNKNGPNFKQIQEKKIKELRKELEREPTLDEVYEAIIQSSIKTDFWTNMKFLTW